MIKSELVNRLSDANPHLYRRDVEKLVNAILSEITMALERGGRVEIRGFGAFSVKFRAAHTGRNPLTGAAVQVTAKKLSHFKMSKEVRRKLNPRGCHQHRPEA
jgi:integration host factor subunit beta